MNYKLIEKKYCIRVDNIKKIDKGYDCNKWVVSSKNSQFFLKQMNINSLDRLKFINYVQNNISSCEIAPKIILTTNGKSYFKYMNKYYILYEFISGNCPIKKDLTDNDQYELGLLLGKIHKCLNNAKFKMPKEFDGNSLNFSEPNFKKIKILINTYNNKNPEISAILSNKLNFLQKVDYVEIYNLFKKYNNKIVHGDFYLDNIIKNDKFVCIDFDQSCFFPLQYEIYRAISMICFDKEYSNEKIFNNIKYFLKGYKMSCYLEKRDLILCLRLFIYISMNSIYCFDDIKNINYAKYKYEMTEWMINNQKKIIDIIMVI